jgi:hypothetical protein
MMQQCQVSISRMGIHYPNAWKRYARMSTRTFENIRWTIVRCRAMQEMLTHLEPVDVTLHARPRRLRSDYFHRHVNVLNLLTRTHGSIKMQMVHD